MKAEETDNISMSNEQQSGKMWSGRFREPLDKEFEQWQRSIVFDWQLLDEEVAASKAHASALAAAGILTASETAELRKALDAVAAEFASEEGQALVEYALLLSLIAIVSIGVLTALGTNVSTIFSRINSAL